MSIETILVTVTDKQECAQGITSFELTPSDNSVLPSFAAGAHIGVTTPNGMIRQYSLYNAAKQNNTYKIAVLGELKGRGGSLDMRDNVKIGSTLTISKPRNQFPLTPTQNTLLFAGGIGITPILSMAETLYQQGHHFNLHYCGRTRKAMAFAEYLTSSELAQQCQLHIDDDPNSNFDAYAVLAKSPEDAHLYVCGPKGYMDYIINTAKSLGWEDSRIHFEYFSISNNTVERDGDGFQIKIASTDQILSVGVDESPLAVLVKNGFDIPISCEQGICGTCLTKVIDGEPDHKDMFLTDAEHSANNQFTPCCSRSKSPLLVLDL